MCAFFFFFFFFLFSFVSFLKVCVGIQILKLVLSHAHKWVTSVNITPKMHCSMTIAALSILARN